MNSLGEMIVRVLTQQVPTIVVCIYGIFLLALIVFVFLLLKQDLSQLQDSLNEKLGIEGLLQKLNLDSFDTHFNHYTSKLIEYLHTHTNISLPIDPKNNATTMVSLVQYVHEVINDPRELDQLEKPLKWNGTLKHNSDILDQYSRFLNFVPLYSSARPWIVFIMSCIDSFWDMNTIDVQSITNQVVLLLTKVS